MPFELSAYFYEKLLAPLEQRFLSNWRKEALSYLPKNARILEIGAGTGLNFPFYPRSKQIIASEISAEMISLAQTKTKNVSIVQADAENLPFPDAYFDAAFATLVFCSVSNPKKAFAELRRVLKTKDRIILLEHVRPKGFLGNIFDVLNVFTVALFKDRFNRETEKLAEDAGLEIIEVIEKCMGIVKLIVCEV